VPVDIELSKLTVHAPLFTSVDSVTFALATNAGPTAVSCTEISLRSRGGVPAAARNFVSFGWRYRTLR
jgi:hypothetical protein